MPGFRPRSISILKYHYALDGMKPYAGSKSHNGYRWRILLPFFLWQESLASVITSKAANDYRLLYRSGPH